MPRSDRLADMTTRELHTQRAADLLLTTDDYAGTDRVKEYHANRADRLSDEIDSRNNT